MTAVAHANPAPPKPRLGRLALALLAPSVVLAILASWALARDWGAARTDALTRGQELANETSARIATLVQQVEPVAAELQGRLPSPFTTRRPIDAFVIGPSNELTSPKPTRWPPVPEPLAPDLPAEATARLEAARSAFDSDEWDEAVAAYAAILVEPSRTNGTSDSVGPDANPGLQRLRILARFERGLALERAGRTHDAVVEFERVLPDAGRVAGEVRTEAGVPVAHLAAVRILDVAGGRPEALPTLWRENATGFATALGQSEPTPFLAAFFERLRPLLPALLANSPGASPAALLEPFERSERSRRRYATAARQLGGTGPWPNAFWIEDGDDHWLAVQQRKPEPAAGAVPLSGRLFALVPEDWVRDEMRAAQRELDRRDDFVVRLRLVERDLGNDSRPAGRESVSRGAIATAARAVAGMEQAVAAVSLANPDAFFAAQRRRQGLFGGLLLAALTASVLSVVATRRALQRQHEWSVRKSNFVSSVSHELRAPLGSIRLLAENLDRGTVTDEARRREYFRLIGQETRRLGALVENVLDFSRIEQGRKRYDLEPTDLRALVQGTIDLFEPLASARGVNLDVHACQPVGRCEIEADGRALQQALLNLLDNALKHSPAGSTIELALRESPHRDGCRVALSVRDHGPGIPLEDHRRIFEPFYRRGSELRRETEGVGIGLSIVKHVVDGHGGRVEVESEPGRGALFTLVLPARQDAHASDGDRPNA